MDVYETKTNRKKLVNAFSDKSPLRGILFFREELDVAAFADDGRALVFNTALLQPKTSRTTQGVGCMSLKARRKLQRAEPLEGAGIKNVARYRVRTLPAAGAVLREEDRGEEQLSLIGD